MKITQICNAVEQKQLLATNQQAIKSELMNEVSKKMDCGVPSEVTREPPGLNLGKDNRGIGVVKSEPPHERIEDKGPKENY